MGWWRVLYLHGIGMFEVHVRCFGFYQLRLSPMVQAMAVARSGGLFNMIEAVHLSLVTVVCIYCYRNCLLP